MSKKSFILVTLILLIALFGSYILYNTVPQKKVYENTTDNIIVVPTMYDKISNNTFWSGSFNLVWNDFIDDIVKQDIIYDPQLEIAANLNKQSFSNEMLNKTSYYEKYGIKTLDLKKQIEQDIKNKFNETSNVLDLLGWTKDDLEKTTSDKYFLYSMLKKELEFKTPFDTLRTADFGKYRNISYFGINDASDEKLREYITVMYYHSQNDFAIKILTKNGNELIVSMGSREETFSEIYDNIINSEKNYNGIKTFEKFDRFKMPVINLKAKRIFKEVQNKSFKTNNNKVQITDAIETIDFVIKNKKSNIKNEEEIIVDTENVEVTEPRKFYLDDTFVIFAKEKNQDMPYFAGKVEEISKFQ